MHAAARHHATLAAAATELAAIGVWKTFRG
jgi:hypothetical protein